MRYGVRGAVGSWLNAVAGMFVAVFESEFGDSGFIEIAEAFGNHAIVLFLCRAGER